MKASTTILFLALALSAARGFAQPLPAAFCFKCSTEMHTNKVLLDLGVRRLGGFVRTNVTVFICPTCKDTITNATDLWTDEAQLSPLPRVRKLSVERPAPLPVNTPPPPALWTQVTGARARGTNLQVLFVQAPTQLQPEKIYAIQCSTNMVDWADLGTTPKYFRLIEIEGGR